MYFSDKWRFAVVVALAAWHLLPVAHAGPGTAEAEQLFKDGIRLMDEGNYREACDAFQASYEIEPVVNTLANLANCREKNGQLATAWSGFLEAERQTRDSDKHAELNKAMQNRAQRVESRLSFLTISVPDESRVDGLVLTRNGEVVDVRLWNRAVPVDGGEYVVAGKAPAHEEWSTTVHVANENGRTTVDVPKFKEAAAIAPPPVPVMATTAAPAPVEVDLRPVNAFTRRRKVSVGVGVVGLASIGLGIALGRSMAELEAEAREICPSKFCERADEGNAVAARASDRALQANIAYGAGAVAIGAAVVLWLTGAPETMPVSVAVSPSFSGVVARGRF